ncbi:MAG: hypothetical protein ACLQVL_11370 [Terriglobia bacterium]
MGAVVVGGSAASNPQAQVGLAGSNHGSNLTVARNLVTAEDRVTLTRGRHPFTFGAWFQPFQSNETPALSPFGKAIFTSLAAFLPGTVATFLYDPAPTEMSRRSLFGAWYAEDVIRVAPTITLPLGFRDEFTTGWNEAHGRAANYTFPTRCIHRAAVGWRILGQPRPRLILRPGTRHVGFLRAERYVDSRRPAPGASRGDLQPAESRQR